MSSEKEKDPPDKPGRIMDKILAMTAPPVSTESKGKKKEGLDLHPYYKRPGRGHNRDLCDACEEGGDLLCCDKCPASFHLVCHDPPIEESDIPEGQWLCLSCQTKERSQCKTDGQFKTRKALKEEEDVELTSDEDSICPSTSSTNSSPRNDRHRRAKTRATKKLVTKPKTMQTKVKNFFQKASEEIEEVNPIMFDIPPELELKVVLPGDDKIQQPNKVGYRRNSKKRQYDRDGQGLVPQPPKLCFYCGKSCSKAPLISCDQCNLFFHMDCLNPPLTAPPTGHWRCPIHPDNFVDEKLWVGCGITERVALKDKYSMCRVDEHTIKLDFLRKVHSRRYHPYSRQNLGPPLLVQVPESVTIAYKNPPLLEMSNKQLRRLAALKERDQSFFKQEQERCNPNPRTYLATKEEQSEFLSSFLAMQVRIAEVCLDLKPEETITSGALSENDNNCTVKNHEIECYDDKFIINNKNIKAKKKLNKRNEKLRIFEVLFNETTEKKPGKPGEKILLNGCDNRNPNNQEICTLSDRETFDEEGLIFNVMELQEKPIFLTGTSPKYRKINIENNVFYFRKESSGVHQPEQVLVDALKQYLKKESESMNHHTNGETSEDNRKRRHYKETNSEAKSTKTSDKYSRLNREKVNHCILGATSNKLDGLNFNEIELSGETISDDHKILMNLDPTVIRLLALQQIKQMRESSQNEPCVNVVSQMKSFSLDFDEMLLNTNNPILSRTDLTDTSPGVYEVIDDASSDEGTTYTGTSDSEIVLSPEKVWDIPNNEDDLPDDALRPSTPLLIPISPFEEDLEQFESFPINKNNFVIGSDSSADFCLKTMGHCSFVSGKHAALIFDTAKKTFSLINFSEFGTIVDHVAYGLPDITRGSTTLSKLRKNINKISKMQRKRKKVLENPAEDSTSSSNNETDILNNSMNNMSSSFPSKCRCDQPLRTSEFVDSPALLVNGSSIIIGCKSFTFTCPKIDSQYS